MAKIENIFSEFTKELLLEYPEEEIKSMVYILLEFYLGLDKPRILLNKKLELNESNLAKLQLAKKRLLKNEPIQYILGETQFYGRLLKVNNNVLIPRPETEELVELVVKDFKNKTIQILDIGTGSGAIAISLACEIPNSTITAIDISARALNQARENAEYHKQNINFIEMDILSNEAKLDTQFNVIVSNPPYVRNSEKQQMQKNVLEYEPHSALFVEDNNPLVFYESIARFAKIHLTQGGVLYFEINENLGKETSETLLNYFENVELRKDISNKDRIIKAY